MGDFLVGWRRWAAVAVALVAGLCLANPSERSHTTAIRRELKRDHPIAEGWLGLGGLFTKSLTYDSYVICSTTSFQERVVSVGCLGTVHVMRDALNFE